MGVEPKNQYWRLKLNDTYFDLQINGFLGVDFSSAELTQDTCAYAYRELILAGLEMFLPTMITSSSKRYESNLKILSSVASGKEFQDHIPGIHAEGPFLSPEPGAIGAHNPDWVKPCDIDFFKQMQHWANGTIKLLTIAAENPNAEALTKHAVNNGTVISLGHQLATADDMQRLADAGASCLTHLGNGMPNITGRHDNQILSGLAIDELTAMIITDGHHLPPHVIKTIIKAKGPEKIIITSDASPIAGMPPGKYHMSGNDAILEENGLFHNPEKQCLVGASVIMKPCVQHLRSLKLLSENEIKMVSRENAVKLLALTSPD
jgi:N-acetylglucosamine-6-phosphate deacetylase